MIRHLCFVRLKCGSGKRKNIFVSCETDMHCLGCESLASMSHLPASLIPQGPSPPGPCRRSWEGVSWHCYGDRRCSGSHLQELLVGLESGPVHSLRPLLGSPDPESACLGTAVTVPLDTEIGMESSTSYCRNFKGVNKGKETSVCNHQNQEWQVWAEKCLYGWFYAGEG